MAYGGGKARQTTQACCSVRLPRLVRSVVTKKRHRSTMQTKPSCGCLVDSTPTQQSLTYDDVGHPPGVRLPSHAHLFPLSDGACPTVHCSTANPGLVDPRNSTSLRLLPVYQRQLYVGGVACYVAHMRFALPSIHYSTANSGIVNPDRYTLPRRPPSINEELYVEGVTHSSRMLSRKVTVESRWPVVTLVHDHQPHHEGNSAVS